jgi:Fe-S cluster biosynthesis and repair protein YggX
MDKVFCSKLKEELPALSAPPFSGELGDQILKSVSERAWRMWSEDMMIKVINEYRLNLADSNDYDTLLDQMKLFLGLGGSGDTSQLEVENPERGK